MLRPPDRRFGIAHDLRDVSAATWPRGSAPAQAAAGVRLDPQPGRFSAPECIFDLHCWPLRRVSMVAAMPARAGCRTSTARSITAMAEYYSRDIQTLSF